MKFSVFTVSTPEYTPEETLVKLKQYGYDGVEWRVHTIQNYNGGLNQPVPSYWGYNKATINIDSILDNAEKIKTLCGRYDIEICALATYLPVSQPKEIEVVMEAAALMLCPKIRVSVPLYTGEADYNCLLESTIRDIGIIEKLAYKYKIKVNFEIHPRTIIPSASAAYRLLSNFGSEYIGAILDVGNMVSEGYEQYQMGMEILGDYLDHVHIKNAGWNLKEITPDRIAVWEPKAYPLNMGQADLRKLFLALRKAGYDGYISIEDFSKETGTDEKLKNNLIYLKNVLTEVYNNGAN